MRTEVYSWRVSSDLKSELEREARLRKISVSSVLDSAARDWLNRVAPPVGDDQEQKRLQAAAEGCFGVIEGHNRHRAETARLTIRKRLKKQRNAR